MLEDAVSNENDENYSIFKDKNFIVYVEKSYDIYPVLECL